MKKKPVTKQQKFSLKTGNYLITEGTLSQSRGRVLKKFLEPPDPILLDPSFISIACIKVPNEYEQPIYVQSVQKNLVGPKHGDTPP